MTLRRRCVHFRIVGVGNTELWFLHMQELEYISSLLNFLSSCHVNLKWWYFYIYAEFVIFKSMTFQLLIHTKALGRTNCNIFPSLNLDYCHVFTMLAFYTKLYLPFHGDQRSSDGNSLNFSLSLNLFSPSSSSHLFRWRWYLNLFKQSYSLLSMSLWHPQNKSLHCSLLQLSLLVFSIFKSLQPSPFHTS